jgi:hypothetical protein
MEILAFVSFAVLVVAWLVAPTRTAAMPAREVDRAA